jgi:hypothetical protein
MPDHLYVAIAERNDRIANTTRRVLMSSPEEGIDELPMPGRSGAMTVKRDESETASGFHIRESSA